MRQRVRNGFNGNICGRQIENAPTSAIQIYYLMTIDVGGAADNRKEAGPRLKGRRDAASRHARVPRMGLQDDLCGVQTPQRFRWKSGDLGKLWRATYNGEREQGSGENAGHIHAN